MAKQICILIKAGSSVMQSSSSDIHYNSTKNVVQLSIILLHFQLYYLEVLRFLARISVIFLGRLQADEDGILNLIEQSFIAPLKRAGNILYVKSWLGPLDKQT